MNTPSATIVESDSYKLGGHEFQSRLIIGSGKYASFEQNRACADASGAEMVTVALRDPAQHRRLLHRGGRGHHGTARS